MYGFTTNSKPRAIGNNIKLAFDLKDKFSFIYEKWSSSFLIYIYSKVNVKNAVTMATRAFISTQQSINDMWFKNRRDDGVKLPNVYNPFHKLPWL